MFVCLCAFVVVVAFVIVIGVGGWAGRRVGGWVGGWVGVSMPVAVSVYHTQIKVLVISFCAEQL